MGHRTPLADELVEWANTNDVDTEIHRDGDFILRLVFDIGVDVLCYTLGDQTKVVAISPTGKAYFRHAGTDILHITDDEIYVQFPVSEISLSDIVYTSPVGGRN